ncbi:MAG: hypothetical protein P0S93_00220 [Candidatus Neptunochlamydia sp.]|nr:hypothetical protein [Candidatus Neptunochlamydia sp.]
MILPDEFDEKEALEEDVYGLMYGEDSSFELTHYLKNNNIPAVLNGYSGYNIIQYGKISKAWKKTKKFVKKYKKKIIIGTVAAVAVVAASSDSGHSGSENRNQRRKLLLCLLPLRRLLRLSI